MAAWFAKRATGNLHWTHGATQPTDGIQDLFPYRKNILIKNCITSFYRLHALFPNQLSL